MVVTSGGHLSPTGRLLFFSCLLCFVVKNALGSTKSLSANLVDSNTSLPEQADSDEEHHKHTAKSALQGETINDKVVKISANSIDYTRPNKKDTLSDLGWNAIMPRSQGASIKEDFAYKRAESGHRRPPSERIGPEIYPASCQLQLECGQTESKTFISTSSLAMDSEADISNMGSGRQRYSVDSGIMESPLDPMESLSLSGRSRIRVPVRSARGPQGIRGPQGQQGKRGPQGFPGPPGPQGPVYAPTHNITWSYPTRLNNLSHLLTDPTPATANELETETPFASRLGLSGSNIYSSPTSTRRKTKMTRRIPRQSDDHIPLVAALGDSPSEQVSIHVFDFPQMRRFTDRLVTLEDTMGECLLKTSDRGADWANFGDPELGGFGYRPTDSGRDSLPFIAVDRSAGDPCLKIDPTELLSTGDGVLIDWERLEGIDLGSIWHQFRVALENESLYSGDSRSIAADTYSSLGRESTEKNAAWGRAARREGNFGTISWLSLGPVHGSTGSALKTGEIGPKNNLRSEATLTHNITVSIFYTGTLCLLLILKEFTNIGFEMSVLW